MHVHELGEDCICYFPSREIQQTIRGVKVGEYIGGARRWFGRRT
jgi:hypothetical protein